MKIYKSCTPGISDDQFMLKGLDGLTSFVSFERLMTKSIKEAIGLKKNERIRGLVIEYDGIQVYIETI